MAHRPSVDRRDKLPRRTRPIQTLARPASAPETTLAARLASAPGLKFTATPVPIHTGAGQQLGMISWIAPDPRRGLLWILQRGTRAEPILALNKDGEVVHAFGGGAFKIPHAIEVDRRGRVWTVDAGWSRVSEWGLKGTRLASFDLPEVKPSHQGEFKGATDIAFGLDGQIYVSDGYQNARVVEVTSYGKLIRTWGMAGSGPGAFNLPHGLVIDRDGTIFVADRENGRIQHFDRAGHFLSEICGLGRVYALALAPGGVLWVSVQRLSDAPGSPGWVLKLDQRTGRTLGFIRVAEPGGLHTLAIDSNGDLLTDCRNQVLRFTILADQPAR